MTRYTPQHERSKVDPAERRATLRVIAALAAATALLWAVLILGPPVLSLFQLHTHPVPASGANRP